MRLTIHRGTSEIGGTCIELKSETGKILIDFGLPLVNQNKEPFDSKAIRNATKDELIDSGILPAIDGLYAGTQEKVDAILLSHPHLDHYGLLSYINPDIPIYLSKGCNELIELSHFFNHTSCRLKNAKIVTAWNQFTVKDFKIVPYLVDHSGFDAFAFLIEVDGIRLFYSGDFRAHGRKSVLYRNILRKPPKNIDYLVLEGSMINRSRGLYRTEDDIEDALHELFSKDGFYLIGCSSQNIDRLVSVYRACVRSGRIFVIDPYTACILDRLKGISKSIPQHDWSNMRIFFAPNSYTRLSAKDKSLFKFKSSKITLSEIKEQKHKVVVKDNFLVRSALMSGAQFRNARFIHSMWEGYLQDVAPFWDNHKVQIIKVHTSGHAYVEDLNRFVDAIKPKHIIPNHTFYPELFKDLFAPTDVIDLKDGQPIEL